MSDIINYTNLASIKEHWQKNIAPNYFEFEDLNNYHTGQYGMITEIMAETVEDVYHAMVGIRREFYPTTMKFQSTLYKTAPLHRLDPPMAIPATASCLLILEQKEIIERSTFKNGLYNFVLDNNMEILAGSVPFIVDYPIIILAKKIGDHYSFTSHYDVTISNSLAATNEKYIPNVEIEANGVRYLILTLNVRQCSLKTEAKPVQKDVMLSTVTIDYTFDGTLAGFEIFYKENENSKEIQLEKVMVNGNAPSVPFCFYEIIDANKIRIVFTKNANFTPVFNSTVRINVYTTLGKDGNFPICKSDLICKMNSTDYPNNNTMTITGKINGKSHGGEDAPTIDNFFDEIKKAYSTNNTLTTANDIQTFFNTLKSTNKELEHLKIVFRKIRDDVFIRLWGSYVLFKDSENNVIPSNTLEFDINAYDVLTDDRNETNYYILPGTLLKYQEQTDPENPMYKCTILKGKKITDNIDVIEKEEGHVFVSPYLINVSLNQTLVGFYMNSINSRLSLVYTYVNDNSYMQFIAYNIFIHRNAMLGENFYEVSLEVMPASNLDCEDLIEFEEEPTEIRASQNGIYYKCEFVDERIVATFLYNDGTEETVFVNSYTNLENAFDIEPGYDIRIEVGETFVSGNLLAVKKVKDKGRLRAILDFKNVLISNSYYIPMHIESYDDATNSYCIKGYFGTADEINLDAAVNISNGIYEFSGEHDANISIPMTGLIPEVHIFYKNDDANYNHSMNMISYVNSHTLTNTYTMNYNIHGKLSIIEHIDFVRSNMSFAPGKNSAEDRKDYYIHIDEIPVIRAKWAKHSSNFEYLVSQIRLVYSMLKIVYLLLENGFGIDMKFYNTYGKAKFFNIGIEKKREILDTVNCGLRFGVYLNTISSTDTVISKIRSFIKEYVENFNNEANRGQSIYIMKLIAACQEEFSEIGYMEWYGINSYGTDIQTIESVSDFDIMENGIVDFIPEFININSITLQNGINIPDISLKLLNSDAV